jgi:hypothetical protein
VEDMLRFFDYTFDEKMHFYWLLPSKDFTDGIQAIITEEDVRAMVEATAEERKKLCDH